MIEIEDSEGTLLCNVAPDAAFLRLEVTAAPVDLTPLNGLRHLERLEIHPEIYDERGTVTLPADLPALRSLSVHTGMANPKALAGYPLLKELDLLTTLPKPALIGKLKNLERLSWPIIDGKDLKPVIRLPLLHSLTLHVAETHGLRIDLQSLAGMPNLRRLVASRLNDMQSASVFGSGYKKQDTYVSMSEIHLPKSLPDLKELLLYRPISWPSEVPHLFVPVANPEVLASYRSLETLSFHPGDSDLEMLRGLALRSLAYDGLRVPSVAPLSRMNSLERLEITRACDIDLASLLTLPGLRHLAIFAESGVRGVQELGKLEGLEELWLHDLPTKHVAFAKSMPRLRVLSLESSKVADLAGIEGLTALETLDLTRTQIDDEALARISGLSGLRELVMDEVWKITDLSPLKALDALEKIGLMNLKGPLESLEPLFGLRRLKSVSLGATPLKSTSDFQTLRRMHPRAELQRHGEAEEPQEAALTVHPPVEGSPHYWLAEDLAFRFGTGTNRDAEDLLKSHIRKQRPELLDPLEFDTEADAVVILSTDRGVLEQVASIIAEIEAG